MNGFPLPLAADSSSRAARRFALVSMAALLVAGLAGVGLLLEGSPGARPVAAGMAMAYGGVVCALFAAGAFPLLRADRVGLVVLLLGQAFWFGWPALSVLLGGAWYGERFGYPVPDDAVIRAVLYLSVFCAVTWIAYWGASELAARRVRAEPDGGVPLDSRRSLVAIGLLFMLGLLPLIVFGESWDAVAEGILASRSATKSWTQATLSSNPIYVIGRASLVTAGELALCLVLLSSKQKLRAIAIVLFLVAFGITYFDSGTRSWTAVVVLPPLLVLLRRSILAGKLKRWIVVGPAIVLLVLWVTQAQLAFRKEGARADVFRTESPLAIWDNDFFSETAVAADLVPSRMEFLRQSQALLFLVNPIPRIWWPEKPYPRVLQMYGIGRRGYDEYFELGSSSMPSVVGQFHMTDGLLGVVMISVFYGATFGLFEVLWRRREGLSITHLLAATAWIWLFLGFRGLLPGFHYPVVLLGLVLFARSRRRRVKSAQPAAGASIR